MVFALRSKFLVLALVGSVGGCPDFAQATTDQNSTALSETGATTGVGTSGLLGTSGQQDGATTSSQTDSGTTIGLEDGTNSASGPDTSMSGSISSGSSETGGTTTSRPECGNKIIEDGEECDDGEATRRCTAGCLLPRCDDGFANGDETGIDCGGGTCEVCDVGQGCIMGGDCQPELVCGFDGACRVTAPASCLEHLTLDPVARSGTYDIDPLGNGGVITVDCDMESDGGGWTVILQDDFDGAPNAGWSTLVTTVCGVRTLLGGYDEFGMDAEATIVVDTVQVPHDELRIDTGIAFIDSWDDGEVATVHIDGTEVISEPDPGNGQQAQVCGAQFNDNFGAFDAIVSHTDADVDLVYSSTLGQPADDESWGIDWVTLGIR